jgi:hypothetical protein
MRKLIILTIFAIVASSLHAKKQRVIEPSTAWTVLSPLGLHEQSTIDTLMCNYSRQSVPSEVSDAWACTGNLGAEGTNEIWLDHTPQSDFFFRDALSAWLPSLSNMKFYNTRIPMTLLSYNTSGGKENAQDRLRGTFSGNINKRAQIGAMLDYLYSKGSYANQATKDLIWGFNGSYIGERFEFQGFYNHYNMLNKENGGITNDLYITDPAQLQGGVSSINAKSIPTNLSYAHSRVVGGELYLNSRYKVGYWHEDQVNDTTVKRTYIPVSSFIWTLHLQHGRHSFIDTNSSEISKFFDNTYFNPSSDYDKTTYYALTNTFGISLLEGFHKYAKFGFAAYITHQLRRYTQMPLDDIDLDTESGLSELPAGFDAIADRTTQNLAWVGGQLTKQHGSLLTYEVTGQLGFVGPAAGDVRVDGNITSRFRLLGDTVAINAYAKFNNEHAPLLMNEYRSNHFIWKNDFGKERTFKVGGRLIIPHTGTGINVGVENIQNHIYFGSDYTPVQHSGSVQVFSAQLEQNFHVRALHWDNRVTYQTSGNEAVIPLPKLAVYSNLYLLFHIATLQMQFGVDCDYYTKYYAPLYQPATMSFANQQEIKVGNYPFINVYANMKLKKARFFVMFSHVNQGLTGENYFSLPHYPLNPRRFQMGVSIDFAN